MTGKPTARLRRADCRQCRARLRALAGAADRCRPGRGGVLADGAGASFPLANRNRDKTAPALAAPGIALGIAACRFLLRRRPRRLACRDSPDQARQCNPVRQYLELRFAAGDWWCAAMAVAHPGAGVILAAAGCALLMKGSYDLSPRYLRGDLLALFAGLLYAGYLIIVERTRGELAPLPLCSSSACSGQSCCFPWRSALASR